MSATWGNNFKVTIYGESHGAGVGIIIDGLPGGLSFNEKYIMSQMDRRKPGKNEFTTSRKEEDYYKVISGVFQGKTTGTPINLFIENTDTRSRDYSKTKDVMRPGHADYSGYMKYNGCNDYRGGGHFSGRLTAPLVLAGSVARCILKNYDVEIAAHIKSIGKVRDESFAVDSIQEEVHELINSHHEQFPLLDQSKRERMKEEIIDAKEKGDSVGGVIEACILGLKPGVGNPFFDSIESRLSSMIFSIPGIKGIEFGAGFTVSELNGSSCNDELEYDEKGNIGHKSNNNGGIIGGISNGMPIIFSAAVKPTPSIKVRQNTVNIDKKINDEICVTGRHDPCIVSRVVPVIENVSAIVILDLILERIKENELFRRI